MYAQDVPQMMTQLGPYRILDALGQGAMGEVWLARHPVLEREVAIKILHPQPGREAVAAERFRREAAAAARLSHPSIVAVHDFAEDEGVRYLVMEYLPGEDFNTFLAGAEATPRTCVELLAQVAEGLAYAHRKGILHRDIKPSNLRVVCDQGQRRVKIMDFGLAKVDDRDCTASGILLGTADYLAPEYITAGVAQASGDLFALGVVLYQCLAGRLPFEGTSSANSLFKIVSEAPPPMDPLCLRGVHPSILAVVDRALAKDPRQRYPDGDCLAAAMRACLAEGADCAEPASGTGSGAGSLPGAAQASRRRALGLAGAILALALATGGWLTRQALHRRPVPPLGVLPVPGPAQAPTREMPSALPRGAEVAPSVLTRVPQSGPARPEGVPEREPTAATPVPEATPPAQPGPSAPEASLHERLARAEAMLPWDPTGASRLLQSALQAAPTDPQAQGDYLAALYRCRDAEGFQQAFDGARGHGLTMMELLKVPAFRSAIQEETRLHRQRSLSAVLPQPALARMLQGVLTP